MAPIKYPFATACAGCSIRHRYSESPATVAEGLKTISAPVIADIDANARESRLKSGVTKIPRPKIKLFPEAGIYVGDVVLSVFAQILAIRVDHRGGVVVNARDLFFINRHNDNHAVRLRDFLHQPHRRAVGNLFDCLVPTRLLFGAEVGRRKYLLHAEYLHALFGGLLYEP